MSYVDKEKQKAYLKEYSKSYHQKRYKARILEMYEYLGGECVQCKSKDRLEFDHIDPSSKEFSITRKWNRKWEIIKPELDKCQLLCYDCHLIKTKLDRANKQSSNLCLLTKTKG